MKSIFEGLPAPLKAVVDSEGYKAPTPIQKDAIPHVIAGKDVLGIAQTGTGKTAAFVLPMLQRMLLDPRKGIRALILCPTRELAMQVADSIKLFAKNTKIRHVAVYGGIRQGPQVSALKKGVDIVVATPGRLFDLYEQSFVRLKDVEFFVLDEADRMLDMGFINDIKKISKLIPKKRQTLFFSATMSKDVSKLANTLLNEPVRVEVTPQATPVEKIEQRVLFVDHENKVDLLLHLLEQESMEKVLIFTKTRRGADRLCRILKKNNVSAHQIHGDRTQSQRTHALNAFTNGKVRCLVATDVAARGIDIDDISHVINYDLPMEAENYVHRIGRTARAGAEGTAYSFCTGDDKILLKEIHKSIGNELPMIDHRYHSERAKESKGGKGKFAPRGRPSGGKSSRGRGPSKGSPRSRFSDKRSSSSGSPRSFSRGSSRDSDDRRSSSKGKPSTRFKERRQSDERSGSSRGKERRSTNKRTPSKSNSRKGKFARKSS
ncbi:DEAD/DEAH box helicase, partial [Candidatus Woesearchaeota archaeon]|nr:DEAD/DEAH box helicase [Candidatus Woesearchaeota archaeon]